MRTRAIIILATMSAMLVPGVAHAAPGDCLILAGRPVCEPYPPDPDNPFPLDSVCTPLDPIGGLPRKSCQSFLTKTGELVGEPQVFTYPPENHLQPPVIAPAPARPAYVPPQELPPIVPPLSPEDAAPRTPAPLPTPAVETTPAPATSEPAPIDAAPRPLPAGPPAAHADGWSDRVDAVVPWAAGIAAVALLFCLVYRPRRA